MIVILLSIYNSFLIPLQFAIPASFDNAFIIILDKLIDSIFILDIFTNFRTIYIDPKSETVIADAKKIGWNYLKGRFIIDLLASVPFDFIAKVFTGSQIDSTTSNFLSMLKLTRLLRLGRMISYF